MTLPNHRSPSANRRSHIINHNSSLNALAGRPGFVVLRDGATWRAYSNPQSVLVASDPQSLHDVLRTVEHHRQSGGEAAGILQYEAGFALEPHLRHFLRKSHAPLAWFGLYDRCEILPSLGISQDTEAPLIHSSKLAITREQYFRKLAAIRRYIEAGDVYQINFTTRVRFRANLDAWDLFTSLFRRHPAPYAAFVNTGSEQIVSLSPEMFFEIEGGNIFVRPMKGTAPRGTLLQDDMAAGEQLRASEKNRAENVMIVDLMRNDLGRICRAGSVKTTSLFDVERYFSVWQMTSTVKGKLAKGCTAESVVRALFPSGSVTGAPKIRAMEIIAALENAPRGIYTGSIGYFGRGRAQFNVAIRTVSLSHRRGVMGVGGGITHDSSPANEWDECHWKAAFLLQSEPEFKLIETFYWDRGYRFLREHLARLRDSAKYWNFNFSSPDAAAALQRAAMKFPKGARRARMTLASDGTIEITHSEYESQRFGRVGISKRTVSRADRFLYHKTTHREMYDEVLAVARHRGLDDVLFFNERCELTEGAIHNVFVVKNGVWLTPPVTCGLLSGVFRAHLLKTRKNCREAILKRTDLDRADAIYLCNSVRGVYPITIALQNKSAARKRIPERRPSW
ncbi:MAG TPA: aminodeoxychorismate synthase component I [Candidatus Dormibacteraeota bacterium]|nr:aminodeoxychorismate synthase component I [Candidatus Dormibacteraeota bacterium]